VPLTTIRTSRPTGSAETKKKVAARLRERGQPGDGRAADVIEAYLPKA